MKKKFYPNGRLNALLQIEQNNMFAERLKFTKPSIDSTCPRTFSIFRKDFSKPHEKGSLLKNFDRNKIINMKLFKRLSKIDNSGKKTVFGKFYSNNDEINKKIKGNTINSVKYNIKEIAQENLYIYKRIVEQQPTYDIQKYLKEYDKNQYYKQNACKYPSINFFKENIKKIKKRNKKNKPYSCSIETEKIKNKQTNFCKTEFDNFPKMNNNTVTTRYSTNNNTCEDFANKRNAFKGRKKKFKNFTSKDLKELKKRNNLGYKLISLSKTSNNFCSEKNVNKNNLSKKIIETYNQEKNKENKENVNENNKDRIGDDNNKEILNKKEFSKNSKED